MNNFKTILTGFYGYDDVIVLYDAENENGYLIDGNVARRFSDWEFINFLMIAVDTIKDGNGYVDYCERDLYEFAISQELDDHYITALAEGLED